ncbi:putative corepressor interacting with RBPJ 1 [Helianthus annuus]|uniref:Uncharacterized protein n=1 Tax=Helianthus annuus TaxID=4232 RepID=A0A9K3IKC1_HELAN|nr:hypothetical protein HanXRQr2_Chr07g0286741 [Helianthus annuus]KAJ0549609.1 putative corepressor interacting with RBPJ 1 [Helianthus annuus]KAJ0556066.1 putative corepressor interacting with RBPJ 1 [Helianthus annuus]KAJ0562564.1 putative corepressor interacting with RBPJ 1 [Helianthus annuus]KAJ0727938.1 putative corepressor interacting with RBPJ 1 [Helianthus annuus]
MHSSLPSFLPSFSYRYHHASFLPACLQYAQEQEFFRQAALVSKKDQEKTEMMKAVGFMYVCPLVIMLKVPKLQRLLRRRNPHKRLEHLICFCCRLQNPIPPNERTKKPRPKDVFGRNLPTEEHFEALKNAPKYVQLCFHVFSLLIIEVLEP